MTISNKLISKHDSLMPFNSSLPIAKYSYSACVIIVVCFSFLFAPQTAFSFNTREEHALKLIHSLRSSKDFIEINTIEEKLIGMGSEILEILLTVLDEELNKEKINREFAISVIRVLSLIHDPLAIPALLRATNIVDWIVRQEAVYAMTSTIDYHPTNLDMLITILRGNDLFLQTRARDAILKIESAVDVTESLIEEMQINSNTTIRVFIVGILSHIRGKKVIDYLFSLLNDSDEEVRKEAVKALSKTNAIKKELGKDALLKILDIIKDDITFFELWDEVIKELNLPDLKDVGFLIEALKIGIKAESNSLKVKATDVINRIGVTALDDLDTALENTSEDSPFYQELLEIKNNIRIAAKTTGAKIKTDN
ncbi:MAG: HEAT repeat domain-containing protein [Candidatus Anammoxibacter sp.]